MLAQHVELRGVELLAPFLFGFLDGKDFGGLAHDGISNAGNMAMISG
jgi:hypothetical protein